MRKHHIIFFCAVFAACGSNNGFDSSVEPNTTKTFEVWGNCNMCKETIEGSLKIDGVSNADWNPDSKMIEVSFDSTVISYDQVKKNIAKAGYDNDRYTADSSTYNNLHDCCKYERKK